MDKPPPVTRYQTTTYGLDHLGCEYNVRDDPTYNFIVIITSKGNIAIPRKSWNAFKALLDEVKL